MRHSKTKYVLISFTAIGLIGVGLLLYFVDRDLSQAEETLRRRTAEFWEDNLENFLADREVLRNSKLFALNTPLSSDAGPLLNSIFPWTGADTSSSVPKWNQDHVATNGSFSKDARDSRIGDAPIESLAKLADEVELSKWNLSWANRLKDFDHWNIASNSPLATDWNEQSGMRFAFNTALPDFAAIQFAARVLYLQGLRDKNFETRAEQTRQLARLLLTVPALVSQMVAVSILNQELLIREKLMTSSRLRSKYGARENPGFGRLQTSAYKRYVWGYVEGLNHSAPRSVLETLLSKPGAQIGFCPALIEQIDIWKLNLEYGDPSTRKNIQEILERTGPLIANCDAMPGVLRLRDSSDQAKFDFNDFRLAPVSQVGGLMENALALPFARQYAIRYLNIVARPDYGSTYQRLHNESQP
jgi:hypothetical protein